MIHTPSKRSMCFSVGLILGGLVCGLLCDSLSVPVYAQAGSQPQSDIIVANDVLGKNLVSKWEYAMNGGKYFASFENRQQALEKAVIYAECFGEDDPRLPITLIRLAEVNTTLMSFSNSPRIPVTESPDILINRAGKMLTSQKTKSESNVAYQKRALALLDKWFDAKSYDEAIAAAKIDFDRFLKVKEKKK